MTTEDKKYIAKVIRDETGCGMMEASVAFETLIKAIKSAPHLPTDTGRKLNFSWELYNLRETN